MLSSTPPVGVTAPLPPARPGCAATLSHDRPALVRRTSRPLRTPRFQRVTARIIATVHLALGARTVTT
ncbi:hypothetical protein [Streptomyces hirsutus]|uniref:hypothetical protein n=1 Tax=Streptomyces hirsutus TaxID=35620 RepID=UPI0006E1F580|nr:hypothetical protein [Streptomyces hirsutus]